MKNLTRHRKIILENMKSRMDHPTARMVYDSTKSSSEKFSFATVYNSLEFLVRAGLIKKLDIDSESARYDAHLDNHAHLICKDCNNVLDYNSFDLLNSISLKDFHFHTDDVSITIRGTCTNCAEKKIYSN
jgi:Fur family transcriptional regulator, peroxide stress response regulator